jgi:hypothetical protein
MIGFIPGILLGMGLPMEAEPSCPMSNPFVREEVKTMEDEMTWEIASMLVSYETEFWRTFWQARENHPERPSMAIAKAAMVVTAKRYGPWNREDGAILRLLEHELARETQE